MQPCIYALTKPSHGICKRVCVFWYDLYSSCAVQAFDFSHQDASFESCYAECDPDLITYNIVLCELSHQSRVAEISELVRVIDQKGLYPDPFSHSALVGGLFKAGEIEMSTKLLLDIISRGCTVDTVMYNICLNIICHKNKSSDSLFVMRNMIEIGFKSNNVTHNTILKGLCKENIDEALELFDCVEWDVNGPDLVSFNTVLSAAYHQGNSPSVEKILDRMDFEGVRRNAVSSKKPV
ncbi:hypothetical protein Vadar_000449 [Vaccinium darrowii]|uniref:Uncharacterized protein n=1 Tax=Vaccinium darrowii TaxID=229202 RepID=A0ACB7YB14_9ERIC|nr:hypothetical protein Vadar_000449 [Vaccinium darrowii]